VQRVHINLSFPRCSRHGISHLRDCYAHLSFAYRH
jgi:hypothetical protein